MSESEPVIFNFKNIMPELPYNKNTPSKEEVKKYLEESQMYPINVHAVWFELLKLIRRVNELENGK